MRLLSLFLVSLVLAGCAEKEDVVEPMPTTTPSSATPTTPMTPTEAAPLTEPGPTPTSAPTNVTSTTPPPIEPTPPSPTPSPPTNGTPPPQPTPPPPARFVLYNKTVNFTTDPAPQAKKSEPFEVPEGVTRLFLRIVIRQASTLGVDTAMLDPEGAVQLECERDTCEVELLSPVAGTWTARWHGAGATEATFEAISG